LRFPHHADALFYHATSIQTIASIGHITKIMYPMNTAQMTMMIASGPALIQRGFFVLWMLWRGTRTRDPRDHHDRPLSR